MNPPKIAQNSNGEAENSNELITTLFTYLIVGHGYVAELRENIQIFGCIVGST